MDTRWTGCGTALVTPFTTEGKLDEASVTRLARRQIDRGIHFLVPCGTTGESPSLSHTEKVRVIELVVKEANGQVPVLAGAGSYDTQAAVTLVADMAQAGVDGVLSVTPFYNKPTQEGLYRHFETIADSTDLPIVLYNVPSRTGCNIQPATLQRLALIPNIVGIKEASGNLLQMCEICRSIPDDFSVLSGDDAFTLPLIALGGHGVISVVANETPAEMASLVDLATAAKFTEARKVHEQLLPLMQVNFIESNPIPVKAAMAALGLLEEIYRLPMVSPTDESRTQINDVLNNLKLTSM
ncbi:MAG TPA: 4-hydroxy-tetrahydrodipicolinate synthase [Acidobacteria bacterium]|nr:4-hydroxy-tetrahydrodipicolinate synthase [Acidobacteriota bacterium]